MRYEHVERYPGEADDFPKCPKCKITMFPQSGGDSYDEDWFECPKCGKAK